MARQGPRTASAQALSVAFLMLAGCGGAAGDPPGDAGPCETDCPGDGPDAGPGVVPDADPGPGLACDPPGPDVMAVTLAHAELPADLAEAAAVPVSEAEASAAGAVPYEVLTEDVSAASAIPAVTCLPGLETEIVLRWGNLPPLPPPAATEWVDVGGYVAVSEGEIELVRALRWDGPSDPGAPRPRVDVVAPQTDPRVLRFSSSIGSGSDGLLVRIRRPVIEPVALEVKLGDAVQTYPLEEHMSLHIVSGGWDLPVGQAMIDAYLQRETAGCYAETGRLAGTWTYASQGGGTALDRFSGTIARAGGAMEPIAFEGAPDLAGPYGTFAGTAGSAGAAVDGYYGRHWLFGQYEPAGLVVGRIAEPGVVGGSGEEEFFIALYDGNDLPGSVAFRRVACDAPGAEHESDFLF